MNILDKPLAERVRPQRLSEYIGQEHLVGEKGSLRKSIETGSIPSMILWGPPGVGKTSLAYLISKTVDRPFYNLSAINSGVKEIRAIFDEISSPNLFNLKRPILFIDEIHRFNKSQQDALLGNVEKGLITLIGATTENPSFEVNSALISRCQVYILKLLDQDNLKSLVDKTLEEDVVLKEYKINIEEYDALIRFSGGDARKLLNILELIILTDGSKDILINNNLVGEIAQEKRLLFDKSGDQHYDIVSALIKSIRGSDPNASVYWLARLIEGGEDPKFIARRLLISASEDIGNANPAALMMANNCFQAVNVIGMPEARIILSQCTVYLACSPKSNASYLAIKRAQQIVKETGDLPVPLHLRNAPTRLMKSLNYGADYKYPHDFDQNFVTQNYFPEELIEDIYMPGNNKKEQEWKAKLQFQWKGKYNF